MLTTGKGVNTTVFLPSVVGTSFSGQEMALRLKGYTTAFLKPATTLKA